jgi:hypothetical protein
MIRSTDDTPMTVAEQYASALGSTNLRMQDRRGAVDVIAAAGSLVHGDGSGGGRMTREHFDASFATALLRLRIEYDLIRGEHRIAAEQLRAAEADAKSQKDLRAKDGKPIPGPAGADGQPTTAAQRAEQILGDAEKAATAAHAMILLSMSTLRLTREMMGHFALREAKALKFNRPIAAIFSIAGQVLDVHIAPTCRFCAGRGFNGLLSKGERPTACRECKGSGMRRDAIGKSDDDRLFGSKLLMAMDALVASAERELARKRASARETKALINTAEAQAVRG